ncbi:hypothetical protein HMPREF1210_00592 [Paenisporosarcina sp. HGH0030]|uniref:hypothetical protein n=1 Tax=Paenisporosarcina sp. HGH0030 TaxID=1078085 RepID=UPI00034E1EA6|nr:hypothetical protein [Paenisporosarcina sp. HGH0030]EPD53769.1 hypothetical protein HMPREF1210_00592 [Paenisporosarcina sp. HGH0030]
MNKLIRFLDKYLIGSVMIICGILLFIITHGKPFKEVEDSLVVAYAFVIGGIVHLLFKAIQKR